MTHWPEARLGDVLAPVDRWESPRPGRLYRQLGVRLWGEGAYERGPVDGAATRYAAFNRAAADDVVVNKIWARSGSVAVVPRELDGCYVSGEFPLYLVDRSKADPGWIRWMTRWKGFWHSCDRAAAGTSGKNRIRPDRFLAITLPLPPLELQQEVAFRLDAMGVRVAELRTLQKRIYDETEAMLVSIVRNGRAERIPLSAILTLRPADVLVNAYDSYQFAGVYSFGRGVFRGERRDGFQISYRRLTTLRAGDFVYPKLMAWEGAFGVVPPDCEGCVVSPEFPVFEIDETRVLREVLGTYFRMPSTWRAVAGSSTGTNVRRRRLHPRDLLRHEIDVPPVATQRLLREVSTRASVVRTNQANIAGWVAGLLASVLDGVFGSTSLA